MKEKIRNGLLAVWMFVCSSNGFAQLSPGELSAAHAHLEGLSNCTKCHILGEKETTSKCLECHREIKQMIDRNHGYHASAEVKGKKCAECHGEHYGRMFKVIKFEENTFDHNLAGYKLEGKHAKLKCADCHKTELIQHKISQKKGITYLGLGTECLSCHADFHRNTLSKDCISCHNQDAFRPAPGFNHAKTDFPLKGKHQDVACEKCHPVENESGRLYQKFSGIEFAGCIACHEDVHRNKFGNDCTKCHNEFSFRQVKSLGSFNHSQTDFPLKGKHQLVDCKKCHLKSYTTPLKYKRCADCHSDYHENQFAVNGVSPDCSECHTEETFSPSVYTVERHNRAVFPLEGAHLATPCFTCHKPADKWNFANIGTKCVDCHEDIHENYLDKKYYPGAACKSCHNVSEWKQISFDHRQTRFQLEGKHAQATCRDCHFRESDGVVKQQFSNLAGTCENCHGDAHYKQFEENGKNECARCHTFNNWHPDKFNHDSARFKLDGEHAGLKCSQCHKPTGDSQRSYIEYKFEDITCASCHRS